MFGLDMNLKLYCSVFLIIFLSELGDKSQFVIMMLSAKYESPVVVFLGSITGLICMTFIAVCFASLLTYYIPIGVIKKITATGFIILGILIFLNKL